MFKKILIVLILTVFLQNSFAYSSSDETINCIYEKITELCVVDFNKETFKQEFKNYEFVENNKHNQFKNDVIYPIYTCKDKLNQTHIFGKQNEEYVFDGQRISCDKKEYNINAPAIIDSPESTQTINSQVMNNSPNGSQAIENNNSILTIDNLIEIGLIGGISFLGGLTLIAIKLIKKKKINKL
jgi:hypothetical protein